MFYSFDKNIFSALTPGHTNTSPQNGESPSELRLSQQTVVPGQIIQLELSTNDNSTFKGFIIQARDSKLKDQQVQSRSPLGESSFFTFFQIHKNKTMISVKGLFWKSEESTIEK